MRLLWPRLMRSNILTQLTQLCLLPVCFDSRHDISACLSDVSWIGETDTVVEDGESFTDCWAESFCLRGKMTEQSTKLIVCSICQAECSYHRCRSALSYHTNAKHPTESSPRLDGRQPTLHDFSRKITRPVREKVTNAWRSEEHT